MNRNDEKQNIFFSIFFSVEIHRGIDFASFFYKRRKITSTQLIHCGFQIKRLKRF
jgi:hypothetical protein